MNIKLINKISPIVTRVALKGKKIAPDVAIVGGLTMVVIGGIWMGKRSHDASREINKSSAKIKNIKESMEMEGADIDKAKSMLKESRKEFAAKMMKTYGPPLALIVIGSFSVCTGHREIRLRNKGLATALGVEVAKKAKLMQLVDKEHGEGTASKWMNDIYEDVVETEDEKGKPKKQKVEKMHGELTGFATFLDSSSRKWHEDPSLTKMMVKNAERFLNRELEKGRPVTGYEYFMEVGIRPEERFSSERVSALKLLGWCKLDKNDPMYISYHIYDVHKNDNERFIQGHENVAIIEPIGMDYIYNLI